MKLLVTGSRGQLGRSLVRQATNQTIVALPHHTLDICDPTAVADALVHHAPDVVINTAAFTGVDAAEAAPERAFAVNADGAGHIARACADRGIPLLHVSTDYVFGGDGTVSITEDTVPAPVNVYGRSKAEGERRVRAAGGTVVRTSWLFAAWGPGFVQTIMELATRERELRVVVEQHGRPTWAHDLADALLALAVLRDRPACIHVCGAGATTWHGFAAAIVETVRTIRPIACERVVAITSAERASRARRPAYSVLDTSRAEALGVPIRSWRTGLARTIAESLA